MIKKKLILFIIISIVLTQLPISTTAATNTQNQSIDKNGYSFLIDPETGKSLPVINREKEFKNITDKQPRNAKAEQNFLEHKAKLTKSNTLAPVPGGVGSGFRFNSIFMTSYAKGSAISYDIICPQKAGGDNSTWLYLTSLNRTAKSVEAYVNYWSQNDFVFQVFDWSVTDTEKRFVVTTPYSQLSNYLRTKTIHGVSYQYITVQQRTELVSGTTWRNIVWLQNKNGSYDQVYSHSYTSSLTEQQGQSNHNWGPIIETFQSSYSNMNTMGFNATYLASADSNGTWSSWALLSTTQSTYTTPNSGFTQVFLDANYGFAAH